MGRDRYKIIGHTPHFFTCTTVGWITIFNDPEVADIMLDSIRYLQNEDRLSLHGYVLMENHMHLIAASENLSQSMHDFKSYTAHQIVECLKRKGRKSILKLLKTHKINHKIDREYQVWQEGSHPEMILGEDMFIQKMNYMHNNPVRRGYVEKPENWRYSSAGDFYGKVGLLRIVGKEGV